MYNVHYTHYLIWTKVFILFLILSFDDILSKVDKWCSVFCHGVQVDDSHVMEQVHCIYFRYKHVHIHVGVSLVWINYAVDDTNTFNNYK